MRKYGILITIIVLISFVTFYGINLNKEKEKRRAYDELNLSLNQGDIKLNSYIEKQGNHAFLQSPEIPATFYEIARNENYILYFEEETLAIAVKNIETQYTWFSYNTEQDLSKYTEQMRLQFRSGLSVFVYSKATSQRKTVIGALVKKTFTPKTDGMVVDIDFSDVKIKLRLILTLENDGIKIELPASHIVEYDPNLFVPGNVDVLLQKIQVYPFFGATKSQNNGYIIIPDGSGALVELEQSPSHLLSYSQPIYGADIGYDDIPQVRNLETLNAARPLERMTLPIFGIIHEVGESGILVNAIEGASYARYNYTSKNLTTEYYQSFFEYVYRNQYKQYQSRTDSSLHIYGFQKIPNQFDVVQKVTFLEHNEASYVGLAKKYRNFLDFKNHQIETQDVYPIKIDILGLDVEQGILSKKEVVASNYEDTIELLETLKKDGFLNIDLTYKTYDSKTDSYRFTVKSKLGGKRDFKSLVEYAKENNFNFNYYSNYTVTYEMNKYTASKLSGQPMSALNETFMYQVKYYNDPDSYLKLFKSDEKDFDKYNVDHVAIGGFNHSLFTHMAKHDINYRNDGVESIKELLSYMNEKEYKINIYNADSYMLPYLDQYYDMPFSSSEQMIVSASIPLLQLIVSGKMQYYSKYLNFLTNESDILLRLIEFGINPSFIMTTDNVYKIKYSNSSDIFTSEYRYLKYRMQNYHNFIKEALNQINGKELVSHELIATGVAKSVFSGNLTVYINYTQMAYTIDGITIPAKGYKIV